MLRTAGSRATLAAIVTVVLTALTAGSAAAAGCAGANVAPSASPAKASAATLCLLNRERRAHGLAPFHVNRALANAARGHSRDMARRDYFDHTAPGDVTFADRIQRANYRPRGSWSIGENIAWGSGSLATPASIVRAWMKSPGHRANILNRAFRAIGVGVAPGVPYAASAAVDRSGGLYTTDFGSK